MVKKLYDYIVYPVEDERIEIRKQHLDLLSARLNNAKLIVPIKFNTNDSTNSIVKQFHLQCAREYSEAINDEIFGLDYLFVTLVHIFQTANQDENNWVMYDFQLKLYAETYVSKYLSVYEKVMLAAINLSNFSNLYKKDNNKYNKKKHTSVIKELKNRIDIYTSIETLCMNAAVFMKKYESSQFNDIRNNATHNFSNFDRISRFGENDSNVPGALKGGYATSSIQQVVENKEMFNALVVLMESFGGFLAEVIEKNNEVTP